MKIREHLERWNIWRKYNRNSKIYKLLVLLGFARSPTMGGLLTKKEREENNRMLDELTNQ